MEGKYKKLRLPFWGPSIGPIEGALCHLCGTPRKIIIFTGQLCRGTLQSLHPCASFIDFMAIMVIEKYELIDITDNEKV